ncbi:MAG: aminopeptidase P family protein [Gemmatimonadetes bacterium]|nr:aminopeptidase P family protein [Gemmatimonadota bacterium]
MTMRLFAAACAALTLCATEYSNADIAPAFEPFAARRAALLDSLGNGIAVLYSKAEEGETGYRSDTDFYYLTGLEEKGAILVLVPGGAEEQILMLAPRDADDEIWHGYRADISDSLTDALGFDRLRRTTYLNRFMQRSMKRNDTLHFLGPIVGPDSGMPEELELYRKVQARVPGAKIVNSANYIENMRMIKSKEEVDLVRKAIEVTHQGITELLARARPGVTEFDLDGVLEASFKRQGAQFNAFGAIIGSGVQSTVLHYRAKNKTLDEGDILLLDVGAEWKHYCADISRTVPLGDTFTPEQAKIYDIVLEAQDAAIAAVKPGATMAEVHEVARDVLRKHGLVDHFKHGTSHHLGLLVHDVADYSVPLRPGMIITVEPGLYLRDDAIGVRIEDDILVTENGRENLSANIPRTRADVEAWCREARASSGTK